MKKLLLAICFTILCVTPLWAFSPDSVEPSAVLTADANAVLSGPGYFYGLVISTDGTNACTFEIFDSLTATGTKIIPDPVITSGAADRIQTLWFNPPIALSTGLSIDISLVGGTISYQIYYRSKR